MIQRRSRPSTFGLWKRYGVLVPAVTCPALSTSEREVLQMLLFRTRETNTVAGKTNSFFLMILNHGSRQALSISVPYYDMRYTMKPTRGEYDISEVEGIDALMSCLREINQAENHQQAVELVSELLLNGHEGSAGYLSFGNNKVASNVGIFNMNSATDCPNAKTRETGESETGLCQVPWESCYAHVSEQTYSNPLPKRRRQEYLWDNIDAVTFADALLRVKERKTSDFDYLRVSESGDFRHESDIIRWNNIAERVSPEIEVYTYSASHKLDWSDSEHFTVNQSNDLDNYGDRLFSAIDPSQLEEYQADDNWVICPFELAKHNGVDTEDRPHCGECQLCMKKEGPNVAVLLH